LASSGSVLELAGIGSVGHGGSFGQLLTESTPVAPPLSKPCHANPVHPKVVGKDFWRYKCTFFKRVEFTGLWLITRGISCHRRMLVKSNASFLILCK